MLILIVPIARQGDVEWSLEEGLMERNTLLPHTAPMAALLESTLL